MTRANPKRVHSFGAIVIAAALSLLIAPPAHAAVIQLDSSFGTDSVIRDLDNSLDFLALVFTMGYGYNNVLANLGLGGDFEGWSVASQAQMEALGTSAGLTHGSTDIGQVAGAEVLRDWFCISGVQSCVNLSSTHEYARGLISDVGPVFPNNSPSQLAFSIGRRFNVSPEEVDFHVSGFGALDHTNEEVFLVRPAAVPEPSILMLFGLGMSGLGFVRRSRARS